MFSMKKRLLALGVASALGVSAGVANAAMQVNSSGIGLYNVMPYYTVQAGNATLLSITNTDQVNGKAVKVRFRGAEWSDDVFDFTLFLSPGDVWTGAVSANGEIAAMNTTDVSCTLPATVNQNFVTFRLQQSADVNAGTREGYVEVITMADIEPVVFNPLDNSTWLYNAIKHVNGVAPCDGDLGSGVSGALSALVQDNGVEGPGGGAAGVGQGMVLPTSSLMSYNININVPTSKAFAVRATAIDPSAPADRKIYWEQRNVAIPVAGIAALQQLTADRIFAQPGVGPGFLGTGLQLFQFDLPDITTPIIAAHPDAVVQRDELTIALQSSSSSVEYVTDDAILATTGVVFTQPTRRFYYEYDNTCNGGIVPDDCDYTINSTPVDINGEALAVTGVSPYEGLDSASNRVAVGAPTFWDREENTVVASSDIVISPTPPQATLTFSLQGEASVISINNGALPTGSLQASLTANNYETSLVAPDGWAVLSTTEQTNLQPLPVIGFTAINVFNAGVAGGTNYGLALPLSQQ